MSTSIDQTFIKQFEREFKQFECCASLSLTIRDSSKCLFMVSNSAFRVQTICLTTVFTLSCTVINSGAGVRRNEDATHDNARTLRDSSLSVHNNSRAFFDVI